MGARILVADDSVTIQKVVELTFSKEDFALEQARSGGEAIRKAKETRPDLVLLDLVMPDMNGYDVCAALRSDPTLRSVPIILLAGTFESFDHQRAAQAGASDFVTKPFESQVLVGKVKQLLFAKSMEASSMGTAARLAAGAVTVTISSAAAAPRIAAPKPPDVAPPAERPSTPAAPEPDELWQLLGGPSTPRPAIVQAEEPVDGSSGEVSAPSGVPTEPLEDPADLGTPDLEPLPGEILSAVEAMDELPFPESLSLDDLLAPGVASSTAAPTELASVDAPSTEPIFELSAASEPPLPMVEVGAGEPPTLSVEDLLGSAGHETAAEDTLTIELPEFDLTPVAGADASSLAELDSSLPTFPHEEVTIGELSLQDVGEARKEATEPEPIAAAAPFELHVAPQVADESLAMVEPGGAEATAETLDLPVAELAAALGAPLADVSAPLASAAVTASEMAAMREAVTERVASDLKRELSEKLLDRFEKIVWEVVPDLAEILITKEIERIRRLAEEEKPS